MPMKGLFKKGLFLTLFVSLILASLVQVTGAAITSHTYRLTDSTEYMDKTYVFTLTNQDDASQVSSFCAEYSAPTFDAKRGLIDWVDYRTYGLEEVYDNETAGRIRAIMSLAGPHVDQQTAISHFEEFLGIEGVLYEQIVSAVQYAVWYFTDELMIVPSSENGYDIYKHLITLPPKAMANRSDLIRLNAMPAVKDEAVNQIKLTFQYDISGKKAETSHSYSKDIQSDYNATEQVTVDGNTTTVVIKIPVTSTNMDVSFDVAVDGSYENPGDIYAFSPDEKGSVQSMVGYERFSQLTDLDQKTISLGYASHGLTVDNDANRVIKSFDDGVTVSVSEIENLNPSGKSGFKFAGWYYYGTDTKVAAEGVLMDSPKHIIAKYSRVGGSEPGDGGNPGGGTNPGDGGNPGDGTNPGDGGNPGGGADPGDGGNPSEGTDPGEGSNPDDGNNPGGDNSDTTDEIEDETIPEGIISNPFEKNPDNPSGNIDDPAGNNDEPVWIEDDGIPLGRVDEVKPPYGPDGFQGEGEFFYYINRFIESGGVPFIIFFVLGILALVIGIYLKRRQDAIEEKELLTVDDIIVKAKLTDSIFDDSYFDKEQNSDNPFYGEEDMD